MFSFLQYPLHALIEGSSTKDIGKTKLLERYQSCCWVSSKLPTWSSFMSNVVTFLCNRLGPYRYLPVFLLYQMHFPFCKEWVTLLSDRQGRLQLLQIPSLHILQPLFQWNAWGGLWVTAYYSMWYFFLHLLFSSYCLVIICVFFFIFVLVTDVQWSLSI